MITPRRFLAWWRRGEGTPLDAAVILGAVCVATMAVVGLVVALLRAAGLA